MNVIFPRDSSFPPPVVVSIVIPFHNRIPLLLQLLDTIPILPCIEVVLVDDHSSDDLSKLYSYESINLRIIKNSGPNRYAGSARNLGIVHSRGDYLLFADSDDLFEADCFYSCIHLLSSSRPDVLFVKANSFIDGSCDPGSRHLRHNWLIERVISGADPRLLVRSSGPIGKFIRRSFVVSHDIRFDNYRLSEDIGFTARLMVEKPVVAVSSCVLYSIRQGNVSLTTLRDQDSIEIRLNALLQYNRILLSGGLSEYLVPAIVHIRLLRLRNISLIIKWVRIFVADRQPLFITAWSVDNRMRCILASIRLALGDALLHVKNTRH